MDDARLKIRPRWFLLTLVAAALVGMAARGLFVDPPRPRVIRQVEITADGPQQEADGVLVGFSHRRAGAIAAAVTFVRSGQRILDQSPDGRTRALRRLAAPDAVAGYIAQQRRQLEQLDGIAQRGRGQVTWAVGVLATRLDAYSRARARVSLWRVGVLSVRGLTAPIAEYTTVTYELVWTNGDWRIWSETQVPGPSPMPHPESTPSSPAELASALRGYLRYPGSDRF